MENLHSVLCPQCPASNIIAVYFKGGLLFYLHFKQHTIIHLRTCYYQIKLYWYLCKMKQSIITVYTCSITVESGYILIWHAIFIYLCSFYISGSNLGGGPIC